MAFFHSLGLCKGFSTLPFPSMIQSSRLFIRTSTRKLRERFIGTKPILLMFSLEPEDWFEAPLRTPITLCLRTSFWPLGWTLVITMNEMIRQDRFYNCQIWLSVYVLNFQKSLIYIIKKIKKNVNGTWKK